MDQQVSSNDKEKLTINSTQRSTLQITNRRDSASSSSRTLAPVAFFHDGVIINQTALHKNLMGAQRRAQAIATAPRRKRYDDDKDDDEADQKKTLLGYIKTSALPISSSIESEHPHSLPQTQSGISLLPTVRVDPPSQGEEVNFTYDHHLPRNRCPSAP